MRVYVLWLIFTTIYSEGMILRVSIGLCIVIAVIVAVVSAVLSFVLGFNYRKNSAESTIGSAENEAKRIMTEAITKADSKKKEAILEGKDEILKYRTEVEKEVNERRKDVQRQEKRLQQKEENLDKRLNNLEKKEGTLEKKENKIQETLSEIETLKKNQFQVLEQLSGFSTEQAKEYLLKNLENELVREKSLKIMDFEQQIKDECDSRAREILALSIQRCAADHASEITISTIHIPSDDMKGRLIGREGRNIRAIEAATGADLIIDDTPEVITVSCFDPIRREIARIAIEKLILDGRIHPTKIEEMVTKAKREVEQIIKQEGGKAVIESGVTAMHPELVKLLGKLHYRTSYGQNVLNHSLEVSYLAGLLASELGFDPSLAKRAGLLHDIGKALDHNAEGSHVDLGVEVAKKYKESDAIIHAIHAHHGDIEPQTVIAFLVQAADAISAARPGARRENVETYLKRLEKLEKVASSFEGVENSYAIQAGREIRVLVKPEIVNDDMMKIMARDICKKIENELDYPGQIKVNMIRESRAVDYAK